MKKTLKIICLFLLLLTFTLGCSDNIDTSSKFLKELDYETFNEKLENGDTFILEVVQDGCSNCSDFSPKFIKVLEEYEIVAYSLNLSDIEKDVDKFLEDYDVDGTPTVMFFKNGKETSTLKRLVGNKDEDTIIAKLKSNGYIEK